MDLTRVQAFCIVTFGIFLSAISATDFSYSCYDGACICSIDKVFHADCVGSGILLVDPKKFTKTEKELLSYVDLTGTPFCRDRQVSSYYRSLLVICVRQVTVVTQPTLHEEQTVVETTHGETTSLVTTSRATTSGAATSGSTTSGAATSWATTSEATTSGSTTSEETTSGETTSGETTDEKTDETSTEEVVITTAPGETGEDHSEDLSEDQGGDSPPGNFASLAGLIFGLASSSGLIVYISFVSLFIIQNQTFLTILMSMSMSQCYRL